MSTVSSPVCFACRVALRTSRAWKIPTTRGAFGTAYIQHTNRQSSTRSSSSSAKASSASSVPHGESRQIRRAPIDLATKPRPKARDVDQKELNAIYTRSQELSISVLAPKDTPAISEQRTIYVLEQYLEIARLLVEIQKSSSMHLFSKHMSIFTNFFIIQAHSPMYSSFIANKPLPKLNKDGTTTLTPAKKDHISSAINRDTANIALESAIDAHDLTLALDIVETSFATKAYRRAKIVRECAIPGAGLALAPVMAYGASAQFGALQTLLDPAQATGIAFAGIMTYLFAVGGMGYVAMTTANDQMERVVWTPGTPLSERWIREDERAALDNIAQNWGFKQVSKRGDEVGKDWEILREVCGVKGMILDRVQLMPGME
ncbi:hypothetical protein MRB53_039566 [Persea americana]|nr:hypothetical protein MRB53_039566 [Persea americana]